MASLGVMVAPSMLLGGERKNYSLKYQWEILTEKQKEIRDRSYASGLPRYPRTLTAIAWQESSFGLPSQMENLKDPSGGVFGNSYITVARRHFRLGSRLDIVAVGRRFVMPTPVQVEYVRERLLSEFSFSAYHSLRTLQESERHVTNTLVKANVIDNRRLRGRDWLEVWSYYNGGAEGSLEYAEEIRRKVAFIESVNYEGNLT